MGIPKFFRFISERWPLTSQEVDGQEMIEFDNMYLDMHSILHNCTHTNDGTIIHLSEEQMFGAIFAYIDHLFNLIKPKKVFYMAIDGVAPRAKMNQQRARRFRSAVEAEQNMKKAIERGDEIPKEAPFDSNAITPGTDFMAKVTEHLKYYINQKVSTDSNWQSIQVILSGQEVPGEGEHKIMEYIRVHRAQPGYDPNTRHCVYGLDADLIMLGLASHEPHFALLREEVTFGRNRGTPSSDLSKQKFYLLHISLVREYLGEEFKDLQDQISFKYDFERILDDFILIMYVIGNDFLPNLPDLHLNHGAFPLLIETFKEAMRRSDGYINESGTINMKRLKIWLDILSVFELDNFERGSVDVDWFNYQLENVSHHGARKREREGRELLIKQQKKMVGHIRSWLLPLYNNKFSVKDMQEDESKIPSLQLPADFFEDATNRDFIKKLAFDVGVVILHSASKNTYTAKIDIDGISANESDEEFKQRAEDIHSQFKRYQRSIVVDSEKTLTEEKDLYNKKFLDWKNQYYKEKLHFTLDDEDKITDLTENYVEGLQWVLNYYYKGVCSWPWYYHYHYAPRISDVSRGLDVKLNFKMGQPFKPFQQLMGVLPARSRRLLPACYQELMTDAKSPIIDFYPNDCETDMNGKTAPWEAVVLLSFVDEKRLIKVMTPLDKYLTPEEKQRNTFGRNLLFQFNPQVKNPIRSPLPEWLPDFESRCVQSVFELPSMKGLTYVKGMCKDALSGKHALAGFPTLSTIPYTAKLEYAHLCVFQQPSRSVSMILTLKNIYKGLSVEQFAKQHLGNIIYANYPYLREYKLCHIDDGNKRFEFIRKRGKDQIVTTELQGTDKSGYEKDRREVIYQMKVKKGLRFASEKEEEEEANVGNSESQENLIGHEPHHKDGTMVEGLAYMRKVVGLAPTKDGAYVKMFSDKLDCFPLQLIVEDVVHKDLRFKEKAASKLEDAYPIGTEVVFLGSFAYGSPAKVVGYSDGNKKLALSIRKPAGTEKEPNFGTLRAQYERHALRYHSMSQVCRMLHISTMLLSKITSMYLIYAPKGMRREDVGLGLKFEGKQLKVLGYTKKQGRSWEFSDLAVATINDYMKKFPDVFRALQKYRGNSIPKATDIFRGFSEKQLDDKLRAIHKYLREIKANFIKVTLTSDSLTKFGIGVVEKQITDYVQQPHPQNHKGVKGIPRTAVFNPSKGFLLMRKQFFELGDRVLYALDSGKVPLFSKGTVVGVRSFEAKVLLQVVFDEVVLTGNRFDGRLVTPRGLTVDYSALLNLTHKQFVFHPKGQKGKGDKTKVKMKSKTKPKLDSKSARPGASQKDSSPKSNSKSDSNPHSANPAKKQASGKKELLSVIKGNIKKKHADAAKPEGPKKNVHHSPKQKSTKEPDSTETSNKNKSANRSAAAKSIYNSVLGNVLSAGINMGPPQTYANPQRAPIDVVDPTNVSKNASVLKADSQRLMDVLKGGKK